MRSASGNNLFFSSKKKREENNHVFNCFFLEKKPNNKLKIPCTHVSN